MLRCACRTAMAVLLLALPPGGCGIWRPPEPSEAQLQRGLLVLYPGAFNARLELSVVATTLRDSGYDLAYEIIPWGYTETQLIDPIGTHDSTMRFAQREAQRIADYRRHYPDGAVILFGYSAGGFTALKVAEALPDGARAARVILLSPSISRHYDLAPALERTEREIVVFFSPFDAVSQLVGLLLRGNDLVRGDSAAMFGFSMRHERIVQIGWSPDMLAFASIGMHWDQFANPAWLRTYLLPWFTLP